MKEKIQVPEGYGSVYPISYWSGTPQAPAEPELIPEPIQEIKISILDRIKTIFKTNTDEK
jgi:hypothetical protein